MKSRSVGGKSRGLSPLDSSPTSFEISGEGLDVTRELLGRSLLLRNQGRLRGFGRGAFFLGEIAAPKLRPLS
ncbi:hypothetical protein [Mesorhizobium sp. M1B.F.Ca.ET.045.04.1.1]|uniref:hypothetical protein n=1 Tax=Mesorhizobium sp. M1B.F.Ca.ET.045.04.1.1 TaxID=2493673 RepID=UPI0016767FBC|nr:hypothetical protein [Mesorhizobium sp. M1B.F.Ca.ET.045.04.1.1]